MDDKEKIKNPSRGDLKSQRLSSFDDHKKEFDEKNPPPPKTHEKYEWSFTKDDIFPSGVYYISDKRAKDAALITPQKVSPEHREDHGEDYNSILYRRDLETKKYTTDGTRHSLKDALSYGEGHADTYRFDERLAQREVFKQSFRRQKSNDRDRGGRDR